MSDNTAETVTPAAIAAETERARRNLVGWLIWFRTARSDVATSDAELARRLGGITGAAVHYWFKPGSTRLPSFRNLVAIKMLYGVPLEVLLFSDPPTPK
ncbi:MAG TPA: hypothetical protein VFP50_09445 [Anaeromyxobacteraceae bacterium]|nr:hypothetical protein [Anaeromyxobacteraceae bacterium]